MRTWTDVAFEYFESGIICACPSCGSSEVFVEKREHGSRVCVDFVCKKCGSADHFDGFLEKNQ